MAKITEQELNELYLKTFKRNMPEDERIDFLFTKNELIKFINNTIQSERTRSDEVAVEFAKWVDNEVHFDAMNRDWYIRRKDKPIVVFKSYEELYQYFKTNVLPNLK